MTRLVLRSALALFLGLTQVNVLCLRQLQVDIKLVFSELQITQLLTALVLIEVIAVI